MKASIAGAIVTNTLFMLGASFLLGGLKHHVQEYNRVSARLQAGLLFLATIALLVPSAVSEADSAAGSAFTEKLSVGLSVLLIAAYGLGMLFSLKTHREFFAGAEHAETGEAPWPLGLALATLAGVTVLVALVSEVFVESVQQAAAAFGMTPAFVGFIVVALVGGAAEMASAFSGARKNRLDLSVGIALGSASQIALVRRPGAGAAQLRHRPGADGPAILAGRSGHDAHRHHDRVPGDQQRALGVVCRSARADGVPDFRHDALPVATPGTVKGPTSKPRVKRPFAGAICMLRQFLVGSRRQRLQHCDPCDGDGGRNMGGAHRRLRYATSRQSFRLITVMIVTVSLLMARAFCRSARLVIGLHNRRCCT